MGLRLKTKIILAVGIAGLRILVSPQQKANAGPKDPKMEKAGYQNRIEPKTKPLGLP